MTHWDRDPAWASAYDWMVERRGLGGALWRVGLGTDLEALYRAASEIGDQPSGAAILDIPCGGGVALHALRPGQGVRYVAADIAPTMLDRTAHAAQERGVADQVAVTIADIQNLQFATGEFDLVASFTSLHCVPDPRGALAELARVTRSGGVITGSTLLRDGSWRMIPLTVAGQMGRLMGPGVKASELPRWLAEVGFEEVSIRRSGPMAYFRGIRANH